MTTTIHSRFLLRRPIIRRLLQVRPDPQKASERDNDDHDTRWTAIFKDTTKLSRYQNVSILDYVGAKDDGGDGDNWSYKTCKVPVKSSPPANQHTIFYRPGALPAAQPTVSKHWKEKYLIPWTCSPKSRLESSIFVSHHFRLLDLGGGLPCLSSAHWCQ